MQTGFAILEGGSVNVKNVRNLLLKNVLDASIGAVLWWLVGVGIATGSSENSFFGTDRFDRTAEEFMGGPGYTNANWLFLCAFAATIASGTVAERRTIIAYLCYSTALIACMYPVAAQVGWGGGGQMSPWLGSSHKDNFFTERSVLGFAGGGAVHKCGGGGAALVGAALLGRRHSFKHGAVAVGLCAGPAYLLAPNALNECGAAMSLLIGAARTGGKAGEVAWACGAAACAGLGALFVAVTASLGMPSANVVSLTPF